METRASLGAQESCLFFPSDVVNADSPQTLLELHLAGASRAWERGKGKCREEVEEILGVGKTKEKRKHRGESEVPLATSFAGILSVLVTIEASFRQRDSAAAFLLQIKTCLF